jgi:CubicO group peptidase (beta-lactamase class C family)
MRVGKLHEDHLFAGLRYHLRPKGRSKETGHKMTAQELFTSICERIPDALARYKVPGVVLGITSEGQDLVRGFGVTNIRHPLAVDENTLFQIGSTTKTFTATAAMRLVEQRKLALDEPVRSYLPDFSMRDPSVTERATMRHLLTHTGGWQGDFFPDTGNGDDALARYVRLLADVPQLTPLGAVWSYNNAGFSVAGRVIERIVGTTYEAALKQLVLEPLGLTRSYLFPSEVMVHGFAVGHAASGDKPVVLQPWPIIRGAVPAGGIVASMTDQLRYARFHLGDGSTEGGGRLLSRDSIALMQKPTPATCEYDIGLAWRIRDIGGVRHVFHGGFTYGQLSFFTLVPQRKFGFALATNSLNGALFAREVGRDLLAKFLGNDEPEPQEIMLDRSRMLEYCGRYSAASSDLELTVEERRLKVQPRPKGGFPTQETPPGPTPPPFRVGFVGSDRIAMVDPPMTEAQGEFLRRADGTIAWLRWAGRIHARLA